MLRGPAQYGRSAQHLGDQLAPCGLGRSRLAPVFLARLRDVTGPAQRLKVVGVPGITAAVKRLPVVALQAPGSTAPSAPPAIPAERCATGRFPSARVKMGVVSAHVSHYENGQAVGF